MRNSARFAVERLHQRGRSVWSQCRRMRLPQALLLASTLLLVSCDPEQARREGYERGHNVGYQEGYAAGVAKGRETGMEDGKKIGFSQGFDVGRTKGAEQGKKAQLQKDWETIYAGNRTIRAVWLQWVEAGIVILAALLILGLLGWETFRLVLDSSTPAQLAVKAAAAVGGGVCAFWAADQMRVFALGITPLGLVSFFLAPAPIFVLWHVGWMLGGFLPCLAAQWYAGIFLSSPRNYPGRTGIHAAIFSILIAILVPVFASCFNTPDIARFRVFDLALGCIAAVVFYYLWPLLQSGPHRR